VPSGERTSRPGQAASGHWAGGLRQRSADSRRKAETADDPAGAEYDSGTGEPAFESTRGSHLRGISRISVAFSGRKSNRRNGEPGPPGDRGIVRLGESRANA